MTTTAVTTSEGDVGAGVDGEAVVLVLDDSAGDVNTGGGADIESVSVVSTLGISQRVVHVDVVDTEVGDSVDAESLNGSVDNVQVLDVGVLERMGTEELGLGLATVAALAIPPALTLTVNGVAIGTFDEKVVSSEGDQGTFPGIIAKGSLSLEDDLYCVRKSPYLENRITYMSAILELGKIKSSASRDGNVVEDNGRAATLALDSRSSISKGAAGTGLNSGVGKG